jgi:hypothetical protein
VGVVAVEVFLVLSGGFQQEIWVLRNRPPDDYNKTRALVLGLHPSPGPAACARAGRS